MKVCIGKREKLSVRVDSGLLKAQKTVDEMAGCLEGTNQRELQVSCKACSAKYPVVFSENILTGEVFYEGPADCTCGHVFMTDPPTVTFDQEEIENMFGTSEEGPAEGSEGEA